MRRTLLIFTVAASVLGGAQPSLSAARTHRLDPAVDRGWGVAQQRCAECHATRPGRDSSDGYAPPFTVLRLRYNEISLAKRIAAVTRGEHGGMPPMLLGEADRQDLVAYIESLGPDAP